MQFAPAQPLPLPATGFLRLAQILGDPAKGVAPLIPVSYSTWHAGVASGRYPKPVALGARAKGYRVSDIRRLIEGLS
jgi:hypothetical protein